MKSKKILKLVAIAAILSNSVSYSQTIGLHKVFAAEQKEEATDVQVLFKNDFEKNKEANEVSGAITKDDVSIADIDESNKALKISTKFDGTDNWNANKHELSFYVENNDEILEGSSIKFDLLIPKEQAGFKGTIKYSGGISDNNWVWKSAEQGEVTAKDFKDLGNGYLKSSVSAKVSEASDGIKKITLQISGDECSYTGDLYVDNLEIEGNKKAVEEVKTKETDIYSNEFLDDSSLPDQVSGAITSKDVSIADVKDNNALKISTKFDGTENEGANKHELSFHTDIEDEIPENTAVKFDIVIPKEQSDFKGTIKYSAGISDKNWVWNGGDYKNLDASDFEDDGDGYLRKTVYVKFGQSSDGLKNITIQLAGYNCNYEGDLYLDNVKLVKLEKVEEPKNDLEWTFDDSEEGWKYEGSWAYNGSEEVSYDDTLKALKLGVDYSADVESSWSEFKINNYMDKAKNIADYNELTFDFIFDPEAMTTGSFKVKLFISDGPDTCADINLDDAEDLGNGLKKAKATVKFDSVDVDVNSITLGIVGSNTDYKGNLYIDNIKFNKSQEVNKGINWNFDTDAEGWKYEGSWAYNGTEEVSYDEELQALKLGVDYSGDVESSWSEFKINTYMDEAKNIADYNELTFDFIFNPEAMTTGSFKVKLFIPDGPDTSADINLDDAEDIGNGLKKAKVKVKFDSVDVDVNSITLGIVGSNTDYKGNLYIDNIKFNKSQEVNKGINWNFDTDAEGWKYEGSWAYNGTEEVSYDEELQALKLGVDYSADVESSWSEFKINNYMSNSENFAKYNYLSFDFIFNPEAMTTGSFKAKLFISDGPDTCADINLDDAEDLGNGLKKANATLKFDSMDVDVNSITLGIVGSSTDYKGALYLDNIVFGQMKEEEVYVDKTAVPTKQEKVTVEELGSNIPSTVKLVDSNATASTADLYAYLTGIGKTDKVIYGHQNDTHHKALYKGGSNSDTKDITGSISGITGMDGLSFTGAELNLTDEEKAAGLTYTKKAAQIGVDAAKEGAITTLSCHMPNFAKVLEKGKDAEGKYDYSGYSPNVTSGDVVARIMPGGDLNEVYNGYLDLIADYAQNMKDDNGNEIPVLFRPFHENNGSWFWWGGAYCDAQAYKNLFAYTVSYLRDEKNVHNFLYVYSPNGPFENKDEYLSRYPGDDYIDILAFDMYHDDPLENASEDPWMTTFKETIDLVQGIADERGKLSAVSETGIRINGGGMPIKGNPNKSWFKDISDIVSKSDMPYYMVWANFNNTDNFFAPFMANETKGHEMINEFIDYYNDDKSVFADGIDDYTKINASVSEAHASGYITSPISRNRILEPVKITAAVHNAEGEIKFNIKNRSGEVVETIPAENINGVYTAEITQDILNKVGPTTGTIELLSGDKVLNHINAIFNIKEAEKNPLVVDDFESYMGDDDLLSGEWTKNAGPGCKATPKLSQDHKYSGDYGLEFNYTISTERTSEGWTGITKSLDADWTGCDALQLWCTPDGKGQKLVIQITSNGEDFEVRMPEFAATTEPKLLIIPFSDFKGKNGGKLDLSKISKMGIWCNTLPEKGHEGAWTVNSKMYFDDIRAVNTQADK
ncbi:MAG: glycosyl hydrolase [Clostridium sp.]